MADDPFIVDSLGWALFRQGRYKEAHDYLQKAFKARPDEAVIVDHLADVLVKLGKIEEAKQYYELALKLGMEKESSKKQVESKLSQIVESLQKSACRTSPINPMCWPLELREPARLPTSAK